MSNVLPFHKAKVRFYSKNILIFAKQTMFFTQTYCTMITILLIFMAFLALGGGIYLFAIEHERNAQINAKISDQEVMRIARENNGRVNVGLLAQKTMLDFTEAERKLYIMLSEGIFLHEYDENYQPVFVLTNPLPSRPLPPKALPARPSVVLPISDSEVIAMAVAHKGKLTTPLLCMKAKLQYDEAKTVLERLQQKGVFEVEVNEKGTIIYLLPDWDMME